MRVSQGACIHLSCVRRTRGVALEIVFSKKLLPPRNPGTGIFKPELPEQDHRYPSCPPPFSWQSKQSMETTSRSPRPSTRVLDPVQNNERRWNTSRSNSHASLPSSFASQAPMTIPHSRQAEAPPPLPPPTFIEDLADGHDLGWQWGNPGRTGGLSTLAPIKQTSSLFGGYMQPRLDTVRAAEGEKELMELDDRFDRRGSTGSTIRFPSQPEIKLEDGRYLQQNGHMPDPLSSAANQRFVWVLSHLVTVLKFCLSSVPLMGDPAVRLANENLIFQLATRTHSLRGTPLRLYAESYQC